MKAVNGYLENGYFIPMEEITFPERIQAVLVYNTVKQSADEEMPDFQLKEIPNKITSIEQLFGTLPNDINEDEIKAERLSR